MNHVLDLNQTQAAVAALTGLLLPPLIAVILQSTWSRSLKSVVSLTVYGVSAVITAAAAGALNGATLWQSALLVFVAGVTAHRGFWEPTGVANKIEVATTPGASLNEPPVTPEEPADVPGVDPAP